MDFTILSVSGKPGLYKLVSSSKMNLIVEALDETHRRLPIFASDRVTSLSDIAMYTVAEDVPLMNILDSVLRKEDERYARSTTRSVARTNFTLILPKFFLTTTATEYTTATSRSFSSGITSWFPTV